MPKPSFQRQPRNVVLHGLLAVGGNVLIGILLSVVGFGDSLGPNLVYSQCIGLCIFSLCYVAFVLTARGSVTRLALVLAAIALGGTLGQILANRIVGSSPHLLPAHFLKAEFIALFFGSIGATAMFLWERTWELKNQLREREVQHLEAEKRGVEAQLRMLQAQIEPHFLFNTLANLAGLIEADPKLASRLLEALNRYLRASLQRTRAEGGTLGDELNLLEAYLEILRIRLGPRLDYSFSVAPALRALPFPPMLLQPLVENAVRHGIEPQVSGGRIQVAAGLGDGALALTVRDTGAGLGETPGSGFGLENVRARLAALFGGAGSLEIVESAEGGVLATLRLPS